MYFSLYFQVGDFALVELTFEEGRNLGATVCYVAQVVSFEEDGKVQFSFLRMKSVFSKDTFSFPPIEDITSVGRGQVKGVLRTQKDSTQRQLTLIKVLPSLSSFNMRF